MESISNVETDEFIITLREVATANRLDGDIKIFTFEIENVTDEPIEWSANDHVFVDDEGFQHEPAEMVTTEETESGLFDENADAVKVSDELNRSVSVVPGAKALGVASVRPPPERKLKSIVYHSEWRDQYELTIPESVHESQTVTVDDLGFDLESEVDNLEDGSTREKISPVATSDNLRIELTDVVKDLPDQDSSLVILAFEVTNIGQETKTWWYDEHIFIDSEGYRLTEAEDTTGFLSDSAALPNEYETSPDLPPETTAKSYTDVYLPADRHLARIHYEHEGEAYNIYLDDELWEERTISHEEFVGESVDSEAPESISGLIVEESPETSYDDIGGLEIQKQKIQEAIRDPLINPDQFENIGITPPDGVLLHGPPGTGKTMLARAVANDSDATFITLAAPEMTRSYLGEGPKLVRSCFEYARSRQPAIIFIDEIDAIASTRHEGAQGAEQEVYRTMLQLLSEMDGFEKNEDVRVLAATNRINLLDRAILRPGRFDRVIEVPKPNREGREDIFAVHTAEIETVADIDLGLLAENTEGMSGAEIEAICTEAGYTAIRDDREQVTQQDFLTAIDEIKDEMDASLSEERYVH